MKENIIEFAVLALSMASKQMNIKPKELRRRLEKVDLMNRYVYGCYDSLHTQSAEYAGECIVEALNNWEK